MKETKEKVLRYLISCGNDNKEATVKALASSLMSLYFYDYDEKNHEFNTSSYSLIFDFAKSYLDKYGEPPTKEVILSELHTVSNLSVKTKTEILEVLNGLHDYATNAAEVSYNIDLIKEDYSYHRQLGIINTALDTVESKPRATLTFLQRELSLLNVEAFTGEDDKTQTYASFIKDSLVEFLDSGKFDEDPVPFGFEKMDFTLGGMHPGEFIVIVGPTGAGKSFLAGEIAYRAGIDNNRKVVFANREMLPRQLLRRILARQTQIPARKLRNTKALSEIEINMLKEYMQKVINEDRQNLLLIPAGKCVTVPMIKREVELFYGNDKPELIIVDYLEELQPSRHQSSYWESIRYIAQELKELAVDLQCPVLTLAQLNAEGIKNPSKADLIHLSYKDIAKKADGVFILFPDKDNPPRPPIENAYYGTPGIISLRTVKYRNEASGLIYNFMAEFSTSSISESEDSAYGSTFGRKIATQNVQSLQEILSND